MVNERGLTSLVEEKHLHSFRPDQGHPPVKSLSQAAIKRRLHQGKYRRFTTTRNPLVSLKNRKTRSEFGKEQHSGTTPARHMRQRSRSQTDGKQLLKIQSTTSSVKHGGGSVVACVVSSVTGSLVWTLM